MQHSIVIIVEVSWIAFMNFRSIQKVGFHIFFDLIQPLKHNTVHNMGDRQSKGRAAGEEILSNMNTV